MFLTGTTNNWHIIKNCWRMNYSLSFTRKYNLLGLFRFIWIKGHFPLVDPIWNFLKSSFNSLVHCFKSWTTEKRDVSSAKSLVADDNPRLRSSICIKKNKGPKQIPEVIQLELLPKIKTDHLKPPCDICYSRSFQ